MIDNFWQPAELPEVIRVAAVAASEPETFPVPKG